MRLILSISFLLVSVFAFGQNATVTAVLDSQEVLIGDQMNLDISVELSGGEKVNWPFFNDTLTGQLEIVQVSVPDTVKKETGEIVIHQRLVITSFDTGFMVLPPISFMFNDDSLQVLTTEPQLVYVSDIPVDMEADIMDVKKPYDVPFNWKKLLIWALIIWLILGLITGAVLYWEKYYKKKPQEPVARPKPKRPAHEIALEKLEALRQKKLWQNDRTKEFYIELSDIVREYIEFQFDVLALEMTTYETVSALKLTGMDEAKIKPLKGMLQLADLAKFAKYQPLPNENEACFDAACKFVSETLVMPLDEPDKEEEG